MVEIKEMPPLLGLNLRAFSKRYGIPYRTLQGWITGERECPLYVKGLLERAVLEDKEKAVLDKIRAEIEQIEINGHIRDVECFRAGINAALNVINKYKAGSEE